MSGFGWLPPDDSDRLEEEQDWIEEHGPIGAGLRVDEADLPEVIASWRAITPPMTPAELAAMPDATAAGDHALLAIEEATGNG